jgi:hypothetical protein
MLSGGLEETAGEGGSTRVLRPNRIGGDEPGSCAWVGFFFDHGNLKA